MARSQEAHPVRLKKIYVVHAAAFINQVMAILKPLIKSELLGLLSFTSKGPKDLFPLALLPEVQPPTTSTTSVNNGVTLCVCLFFRTMVAC